MDVVGMDKTNEYFRLLYDVRGRFTLHRISVEESKYKLCRVKDLAMGSGQVPYIVTHDGRTIRYPDPDIKVNDTIKLDIAENRAITFVKFEIGNVAMATGGFNAGRVGTITYREKHPGGYDIVHLKDAKGHEFATRLNNVFVIGEGSKPMLALPKGNGIRLS